MRRFHVRIHLVHHVLERQRNQIAQCLAVAIGEGLANHFFAEARRQPVVIVEARVVIPR